MADRIEDLLQRRTDLSTFLVHLTRDTKKQVAVDNLLDILEDGVLCARSALGMAAQHDAALKNSEATQRVVCFSETPLEHAWMMVRNIEGRRQRFQPYGVVFSKATSRRKGCNPVWYLDISRGHDWLTEPIRDLVRNAEKASTKDGDIRPSSLQGQAVLRLTPFIEQMGNPSGIRKEFWWEREWRHAGDFHFTPNETVAVIAPEKEHEWLAEEIAGLSKRWKSRSVPLLDATWGLERMIASLARIDDRAAGPFPE